MPKRLPRWFFPVPVTAPALLPLLLLLCWLALAGLPPGAAGQTPGRNPGRVAAEAAYREGFALQAEMRTPEALEAYQRALKHNPFHPRAHYEIGWSYWVLRDWEQVVRHWEVALQLDVDTPELPDYLAMARRRLEGKVAPLVRAAIGTRAVSGHDPEKARPRRLAKSAAKGAAKGAAKDVRPAPTLRLAARFQHYDPKPDHPADRFDRHVFSPKSVRFAPGGGKAYVNALEGMTTLVYEFAGLPGDLSGDAAAIRKVRVIKHSFKGTEPGLFDAAADARFFGRYAPAEVPVRPNRFDGKPVEAVFTHGGRYLWVSYYRRNYDKLGRLPSALAVVDTSNDRIVRVLPTGPIPKSLAVSPDGRLLAAVHWGDNTVGLIDTSGEEPSAFRHAGEIVVEKRLSLSAGLEGDGRGKKVNRDHYCGFCLRGGVFTRDGRYLLVGRMGGGGIAVLDVAARRHVGTVKGMKPTPRHLVLSPDGGTLYVSSSASGYVSSFRTSALVEAALAGEARVRPLHQTATGRGTRTIALSPGGRVIYAAVNYESKVVALDAQDLHKLLEIPADSFPVGVAVSPDGRQLWVTSQGLKLRGGNSISIYSIE